MTTFHSSGACAARPRVQSLSELASVYISAIIPVKFPLSDTWQKVLRELVHQRRCPSKAVLCGKTFYLPFLEFADRVCQQNTSIQFISDKTPANRLKYIGMDMRDNSSDIECRECRQCHEKQPATEFVNPRRPSVPTILCQRCRSRQRDLHQQSSR